MPESVLPADVYDEALVANVRPPGWQGPEPASRYHLAVLGAGTAGLVAAAGAAMLGAKVALVERHLLGGDCLNYGCVPSKALLRAARAAADVRDAGRFGVEVPPGVRVHFPAVMERMRRLRAEISAHDSAQRFRGLGVDVFLGEARFFNADAVRVDDQVLRFRRAVIATGSRPAVPPVPGLAEAGCLTNETVFALAELPPRLAVIGGGPVGCELAQAFARFGSQVTLVHSRPRLLPRDDPDAARLVHQALERDGVRLLTSAKLVRVERQGTQKILEVESDGAAHRLEADAILVAVGRRPNVEGLDLEAAGVAHDHRGVRVDDRLRTTNPRVYAAGDVCSRYKFTHTADAQARIVVRNALFPGSARAGKLVVPWCTYTDPEVAHVGLSADEAREQGIAIQTFVQELRDVDRALLDSEADGFVKVHVRKGGRIVGATVVARHAGDMISELTLAMVGRLGLGTLGRTIHPYPTQAEAIKKTGDAYERSRLTPFVKWLFQKWLRWTR